jgi:hypothetical protein
VYRFRGEAEELEILQALNIFLSQCLSTEVENAMVRYEQLPEWQKTSLARLPEPYTADSVPNSQKLNEKKRFLRMLQGFLDSRGECGAYCLKLVPFVCRTDALNPVVKTPGASGPSRAE